VQRTGVGLNNIGYGQAPVIRWAAAESLGAAARKGSCVITRPHSLLGYAKTMAKAEKELTVWVRASVRFRVFKEAVGATRGNDRGHP
jgi:hypothetical protein